MPSLVQNGVGQAQDRLEALGSELDLDSPAPCRSLPIGSHGRHEASARIRAPGFRSERLSAQLISAPTRLPDVRGSGSDDLTSGVAHSHVGLAIASSPTTRATAYVELGARELGGAVVFSPNR